MSETWETIAQIWAQVLEWVTPFGEKANVAFGMLIGQIQEISTTWFGGATPISEEHAGYMLFGVGLFLLGLASILIRRRRVAASPRGELAALTKRPRRWGYLTAFLLIFVFGGWSIYAPLASAAVAMGVVSPDGNRKTLAHLEGGIARQINVREGDTVEAGQALVVLEDVQARSQFEQLRERYHFLLATRARLDALRKGVDHLVVPSELTGLDYDHAKKALEGQQLLLESQRSTYEGRERILSQRIEKLGEQSAGLRQVTVAQDRQIELLQADIDNFEILLEKGLTQASRLSALKREQADLMAEKAENLSRISANEQNIGEAELQLLTMREVLVETANDEISDVDNQLAEIRTQLRSREDVLARTVVRAPIAGTVMNIRLTTESGVIQPGQPLLDIVPIGGPLIIDARVRPMDIDNVTPGMTARVLLTAYRQRNLPLIHGTLRSISADRVVEERTGEVYFLAKVEVQSEDLDGLGEVRLMPGMPAEVMILNAEQTLLGYLLSPLLRSVNRSFRES